MGLLRLLINHKGSLPNATSLLVNDESTHHSISTDMAQAKLMRAVVFNGVENVSVEDRPVPSIQDPRDAIIKVTVAALCGSDLHWYRGHQNIPTGFIPGHEFAGVIHEMGSQVTGLNVGDSVVVRKFHLMFSSYLLATYTYPAHPSIVGDLHYAMWRVFLLQERTDKSVRKKLPLRYVTNDV